LSSSQYPTNQNHVRGDPGFQKEPALSKHSRRDFLRSAGLAGTFALAQSTAVSAQTGSTGKSLPEPIAKLKSRKAEAKPITVEERQQRIDRARQLMAQNNLDAIMMIGGTSLVYFTNIHWWNSERLFAMVLPAKGNPFYVCPAFEEDRARDQLATGPGGSDLEILTWQARERPYLRVAQH